MSVDHDLLLRWCSERGSGSFNSFREAHDWLRDESGDAEFRSADARPLQERWTWALQSLQALAHVEVDWLKRRWHVAPPVVSTLTDGGGFALLCGARPAALVRRLDNIVDDPDPRLRELSSNVVFDLPVPQRGAPSLRLLQVAALKDAQELCSRLGISFVDRVADQLIRLVPDLNGLLHPGKREDVPGGIAPAKMTNLPDRPLFVELDADPGEAGAYEVRLYDSPRYFYRHSPGKVFEAERGAVVWGELRRTGRHVLRYDPARHSLLVPPRMRLPALYDRAATLRSGLLPQLEKIKVPAGPERVRVLPLLRYSNIDLSFATGLAKLLDQPLQQLGPSAPRPRDLAPATPRHTKQASSPHLGRLQQ